MLFYSDTRVSTAGINVSTAGITVNTGRKWLAEKAVEHSGARLGDSILVTRQAGFVSNRRTTNLERFERNISAVQKRKIAVNISDYWSFWTHHNKAHNAPQQKVTSAFNASMMDQWSGQAVLRDGAFLKSTSVATLLALRFKLVTFCAQG